MPWRKCSSLLTKLESQYCCARIILCNLAKERQQSFSTISRRELTLGTRLVPTYTNLRFLSPFWNWCGFNQNEIGFCKVFCEIVNLTVWKEITIFHDYEFDQGRALVAQWLCFYACQIVPGWFSGKAMKKDFWKMWSVLWSALVNVHTVKIRDSALGLSGFVSFFWWAYLRGGSSKENL